MIYVEDGNPFFAEAQKIQQQKFAERTEDIRRIVKLLGDNESGIPEKLKKQLKRREKIERRSN